MFPILHTQRDVEGKTTENDHRIRGGTRLLGFLFVKSCCKEEAGVSDPETGYLFELLVTLSNFEFYGAGRFVLNGVRGRSMAEMRARHEV